MAKILVVDDEQSMREFLEILLTKAGHEVSAASNLSSALTRAAEGDLDLVLSDLRLGAESGISLLQAVKARTPSTEVVILTAFATTENAIQAMKLGAYDYVLKPFKVDELKIVVEKALEHRSLLAENRVLRHRVGRRDEAFEIVGKSAEVDQVRAMVEKVARAKTTVLLTGASGTGKEVVARAIHAGSARRYNPMVVVNCGALPEGILESELFGHEAGAFTGARARHKGKFESAEGGTVFLDEIGEVSPKVQVELLRVLEEKTVTRLGGTTPVAVDFRTITATNRDLAAAVKEGAFREDLYWRLNVVHIHIPPLRERPLDVPVLAEHFLSRFAQSMSRRPMRFSAEALSALASYPWPGNVRELQNAIERAVVVGRGEVVQAADLPLRVTQSPSAAVPGPGSLAEAERAHVQSVLESTGWNITRAARILDVDRVTLYNKIRRYELKKPDDAG